MQKTPLWKIEGLTNKPKLNKPVLIEGMPGIGNVGKIAVEYLIEELDAEKYCSFFSHGMSHSVFVNENNLVEMPVIELYYKKAKNNARNDTSRGSRENSHDILLLVGDVQPPSEVSAHEFCELVLDVFEEFNGSEIITLGGIGLQEIPENPRVYCTGNSKKAVEAFVKSGKDANKEQAKINTNLYGIVGPIVGVSGMLLGLSGKRKVPAITLLVETFGHPMYIGLKESRCLIYTLSKKLGLRVNLAEMDKEIQRIEKEIKKAERIRDIRDISSDGAGDSTDKGKKHKKFGVTSYIG